MIIETSCNRFYDVWEIGAAGLEHCWYGYRLKKTRDGFNLTAAAAKARAAARPELVRKAATRIVEDAQ